MITLSKFYDLVSRTAMVTLANKRLDAIFYEGSLKDIPDAYDDWEVLDFSMNIDCAGDCGILFKVQQYCKKIGATLLFANANNMDLGYELDGHLYHMDAYELYAALGGK